MQSFIHYSCSVKTLNHILSISVKSPFKYCTNYDQSCLFSFLDIIISKSASLYSTSSSNFLDCKSLL